VSGLANYSVAGCVARIEARNDALNAVLTKVAPSPTANPSGPLANVPYVLKDTWDTAGVTTTGGSWRHRNRVPATSSHIYRALRDAGAVLLGKSNLCDLAFSTESNNHLRGPVRNPFDLSRTAGGSTGGGAAAVADGMAAFEWGSDFGGSIRGPAAWCGLVGLRLSAQTWPVGFHHFPRLPPFFWEMCGMGPMTRDIEGARKLVDAVRNDLRKPDMPSPRFSSDRVVVWPPDRAHDDDWPSFMADTGSLLHEAGIGWSLGERLPSPTEVNELFTEYLVAHWDLFMREGDMPVSQALPAVLLGLISNGRLDRRIHPNTGVLLLAVTALMPKYRKKGPAAERRQEMRRRCDQVWDTGALIVSPTVAVKPPRHGRGALTTRSMSFCKLGNLIDATGLAIPFGVFPGTPALPRSLQIMGPPGSEEAVLDLGDKLAKTISRS
jgi:Asp-tRNA(Asn)/Glu-tRNA(Gln) amidotransferase A subunit family amidase